MLSGRDGRNVVGRFDDARRRHLFRFRLLWRSRHSPARHDLRSGRLRLWFSARPNSSCARRPARPSAPCTTRMSPRACGSHGPHVLAAPEADIRCLPETGLCEAALRSLTTQLRRCLGQRVRPIVSHTGHARAGSLRAMPWSDGRFWAICSPFSGGSPRSLKRRCHDRESQVWEEQEYKAEPNAPPC
jgi:hypothetical protein